MITNVLPPFYGSQCTRALYIVKIQSQSHCYYYYYSLCWFVCLSVRLSMNKITQKVVDRFSRNLFRWARGVWTCRYESIRFWDWSGFWSKKGSGFILRNRLLKFWNPSLTVELMKLETLNSVHRLTMASTILRVIRYAKNIPKEVFLKWMQRKKWFTTSKVSPLSVDCQTNFGF